MSMMASQITNVLIVQRKHYNSASAGLCEGNLPVTGGLPSQRASNAEMFPFDDVIMMSVIWCSPQCVKVEYR